MSSGVSIDPNTVLDIEEEELEEISFDVVDEEESDYIDYRDYAEKCFLSFSSDKGVVSKPVRRIVCSDNDEPKINGNEIVAIFKYKAQPAKGRKNPLAGQDIIHVPTPTGPVRLPIDQAEKFGRYLISVARSIEKSQTNDNTEN